MNPLLFVVIVGLAVLNLSPAGLAEWVAARTAPPSSQHSIAQPAKFQRQPLPVAVGTEAQPAVSAASLIVVDIATSTVLDQVDAAKTRPIASVTKIVTALVILHQHNPNELVTIPDLPAYTAADEVVGLAPGERFKVVDLLKALLINSGNDAGDALAILDAGSTAAFAQKMNAVVADWGIDQAHFSNPTGLIDNDNYASAAALVKLTELALVNPLFASIVATPSAVITDTAGRSLVLHTTNQLLLDGRFSGIKTGYTLVAGQTLVTQATIHGHRIITVVLNSTDRFGDTAALVNWVDRNFAWQ